MGMIYRAKQSIQPLLIFSQCVFYNHKLYFSEQNHKKIFFDKYEKCGIYVEFRPILSDTLIQN